MCICYLGCHRDEQFKMECLLKNEKGRLLVEKRDLLTILFCLEVRLSFRFLFFRFAFPLNKWVLEYNRKDIIPFPYCLFFQRSTDQVRFTTKEGIYIHYPHVFYTKKRFLIRKMQYDDKNVNYIKDHL